MRLVLVFLALLAYPAEARTLAVAVKGGVSVALTDERCQLEAVSNLPSRAVWTEQGRSFEGCYGVNGMDIVAYFDDRTVAVLPLHLFRPLRQA